MFYKLGDSPFIVDNKATGSSVGDGVFYISQRHHCTTHNIMKKFDDS